MEHKRVLADRTIRLCKNMTVDQCVQTTSSFSRWSSWQGADTGLSGQRGSILLHTWQPHLLPTCSDLRGQSGPIRGQSVSLCDQCSVRCFSPSTPPPTLSFHKPSLRLKTTIKNTSAQKRSLWSVYSGILLVSEPCSLEPLLKMGLISLHRMPAESPPEGEEEQEAFISTSSGPASEVWILDEPNNASIF